MPRTADWFSNLSKKAQAEYLKAHPNSKYGKANSKASASDSSAKSLVSTNAEIVKLTMELNKMKRGLTKASTTKEYNTVRSAMEKAQERIQKLKDSRTGKKPPSAASTSKDLAKAESKHITTSKTLTKLNNRHIALLGKIKRHKAGVNDRTTKDPRYKNLVSNEKKLHKEVKKAWKDNNKANQDYKIAELNHSFSK